jgi:uncharacterized protein YceK
MNALHILGLASLALCSGCGSMGGRAYGPPQQTYIGVRADSEYVSDGHPLWLIDMPFSAIADTLLLPFDLCNHKTQTPPDAGGSANTNKPPVVSGS